jgi:hypothetical protein
VQIVKSLGQLLQDGQGFQKGERAVLGQVHFERLAFHQSHGQVENVVGRTAEVEDGDDVGVMKTGRNGRFLLEAFDKFWIVGSLAADNLQGHQAVLIDVPGTVNYTKPTPAEFFYKFVVTNMLSFFSHAAPELEERGKNN